MTELVTDGATALLLAFAAYASTNFDNLVLMATIKAGAPDQRAVTRGYIIATAAVLCVSLTFVFLSLVVAPHILGYLGIIPVLFGTKMLLNGGEALKTDSAAGPAASAIAMLLFANSTDTMAVFGSLVAESENHVVVTLATGFVIAAMVWLRLIRTVSSRVLKGTRAQSLASRLMPFVMIAIGIYILIDSGTDLQK